MSRYANSAVRCQRENTRHDSRKDPNHKLLIAGLTKLAAT